LFHRYFSFPSFRLLVIFSGWGFQGGCCRSYNCSLRSVIYFLRSPLERPSMANISTPPPDFCFMSCRDGFTNHRWFTSPLAHESPKPTPSYVYIAYSSVFPFYADIIPNPYPRDSRMGYARRGLLPMSVSHGLCPVSHRFGFDGTFTTLLRSI
jgi:hypothetical protein